VGDFSCFRSPSTHRMSPWVKRVFLDMVPRILMMRRPPYSLRHDGFLDGADNGYSNEMEMGCVTLFISLLFD